LAGIDESIRTFYRVKRYRDTNTLQRKLPVRADEVDEVNDVMSNSAQTHDRRFGSDSDFVWEYIRLTLPWVDT
jgi:hypothetical protein